MHKPYGLTCDTKDKKLSVYEWNVRLGERESVAFGSGTSMPLPGNSLVQ